MKILARDPHSGGVKIPKRVQELARNRILAYAEKYYAGKFIRIEVRFRGHFCYVDAYIEPFFPQDYNEKQFGITRKEFIERSRNTPTHLCRFRYFGDENSWSLAFYTYSNEKYSPCAFNNGTFYGTLEEGFEISSIYLQG
ncbi:MAG: hypothetical protein K8T10_20475 [Candidatus Eremiobacteraeota bacterium]|nr:hypothetical protein [Candidatus Eremiobacteraeota bacterium]